VPLSHVLGALRCYLRLKDFLQVRNPGKDSSAFTEWDLVVSTGLEVNRDAKNLPSVSARFSKHGKHITDVTLVQLILVQSAG
jgi:hypothetical protein